jgi:hypothetical protein
MVMKLLAIYAILWGLAGDWVKVKLDAASRQYCHEIRFPVGWQSNPNPRAAHYEFDIGHYEFRVSGLPSTKFLVRGFVPALDDRFYTTNLYSVDLSDPAGVAQPASEEEWNSAHPAESEDKHYDRLKRYLKSLGFPFKATGDHEEGWSLSPDRAVFIRYSWKGNLGCCGGSDVPGDVSPHFAIGRNSHGTLFYDAYSTSTGKKLVTFTAKFSIILPEVVKPGWVTGRYFYIPLGDKLTRCLICEFGSAP